MRNYTTQGYTCNQIVIFNYSKTFIILQKLQKLTTIICIAIIILGHIVGLYGVARKQVWSIQFYGTLSGAMILYSLKIAPEEAIYCASFGWFAVGVALTIFFLIMLKSPKPETETINPASRNKFSRLTN